MRRLHEYPVRRTAFGAGLQATRFIDCHAARALGPAVPGGYGLLPRVEEGGLAPASVLVIAGRDPCRDAVQVSVPIVIGMRAGTAVRTRFKLVHGYQSLFGFSKFTSMVQRQSFIASSASDCTNFFEMSLVKTSSLSCFSMALRICGRYFSIISET